VTTAHPYAVYRDASRHTCIKVAEKGGIIHFIPFNTLELRVERASAPVFEREWELMADYDPQRAATTYMYTGDGVRIPIASEASAHLTRIAGPRVHWGAITEEDANPQPSPKERSTMATKKTAAPADEAVKKKPAAKAAKAVAAAPAAKKTATAKAAAKVAAAPAEGRRGRPPAFDPAGTFKVDPAGAETVKRGAYREIVDAALKLETFTLDKLAKACSKITLNEGQLNSTFTFGFRKGVFVPA
jgi:hypothetical protein